MIQKIRADRTFGTFRFASTLALAALFLLAPAAVSEAGGKSRAQSQDIVNTAIAAGSFETLVTAVKAAGLVETLKGEGPFTVFAPTDEAFAKLPPGTLESLLADKKKLTAVLTYHVVAGRKTASDVIEAGSLPTVQGSSLTVDTKSGVKIGGASVVSADVETANGVIHVIDQVLIPTH